MHRQDQDAHLGPGFAQLADEIDTVLAPQGEIQDDDVGGGTLDLVQSVADAVGLSHDIEVGMLREQLLQAFPHHRVIVDDDHPGGFS